MKYFFTGNTGFNKPDREREVLESINNRFHSYGKWLCLNNLDIIECINTIANQMKDARMLIFDLADEEDAPCKRVELDYIKQEVRVIDGDIVTIHKRFKGRIK